MKYRILRDCMISGAKVRAGDSIYLDDSAANTLMSMGRAVPEDAMPKTSDRQVKEVQTRGNRKTTTRKQSRKPRAASQSSGGDSKASSGEESSDS